MQLFPRIIRYVLLCAGLPLLPAARPVHAAVIFEDTFDDGDAVGWAPYNDSTFRWAAGAFAGSGSGGNGIYTSIHSGSYGDYTYRASFVRTGGSQGSFGGLALRVQPDGSQYLFGVSRYRSYWFARVDAGAVTVLRDWTPHSAFDSTANDVAVSCSGGTFWFYANGRYLGRITDAAGPVSGSVGLFVQHDARMVFDNVVVDDIPQTDEAILPFYDAFEDGTMDGWFTHGGDVFRVADGYLTGAGSGGGYLYRCYVSGGFSDFTAVTTVRRTGGSRYYPAGLSLRGQDDAYHSGYLFAVNGNQEFMFARAGSGSMTNLSGWTVHSAILDSVNTLQAVCVDDAFSLSVNGTVVGSYNDGTFAAGAVGVFVSDDVHAVFDRIDVRSSSASGVAPVAGRTGAALRYAVHPNPYRAGTRITGTGAGTVKIYSCGGRTVRTLAMQQGAVYWDGCDEGGVPVPAGMYIVRLPGGVVRHVIRRP